MQLSTASRDFASDEVLKPSQLDDELIEDQNHQITFGKVAECDWIFIISLLDNQYIYIYIYKYLTHMNQPEMYGTRNALNNDHQLQETYCR